MIHSGVQTNSGYNGFIRSGFGSPRGFNRVAILDESESMQMALELVKHLQNLQGSVLEDFIRRTYQTDLTDGLSTQTIFVVEVEDANFARGEMSSIPTRCWRIQNGHCILVPFVDMNAFNAASDDGNLWPHPIVKFCVKFPQVLMSETIGIEDSKIGRERLLICYRLLRIEPDRAAKLLLVEEKSWLFAS